jgi:hypothetical protein
MRRRIRALLLAGFTTLLLAAPGVHSSSERDPLAEYPVKAAFLYHFVEFVEWPRTRHPEPAAVTIGVLGRDPFGEVLDNAILNKMMAGRTLTIRRFATVEALEPCVRRPEVIEQPSRRRDDHVDAAPERVLLRAVADAAEHRRAGHGRVHAEILQVLENLRGQFARGREHERARGAPGLVDQVVQNRQQKRRGLAAARLGAGKQIAACERRRNCVGLNRRRPLKTEVFDAAQEIRVKLQMRKWHW